MPTRLYNGAAHAGAFLDRDEATRLVIYLARERHAGQLPRELWPFLADLAPIALAATGHDPEGSTSALAADGHGLSLDHAGTDIVGVMETADLLNISERSARRVLERIGTKVAGRRVAHRADVEREQEVAGNG
jgi:hypothetical protein